MTRENEYSRKNKIKREWRKENIKIVIKKE